MGVAVHQLDGYEFQEQLRTDGVRETWKARQTETGDAVVIKVLASSSYTAEMYARIVKNAEGAISHPHTNLANLLKLVEQDSRTYLVTEWVDGETLQSLVQRDGVQSQSVLIGIATCVAGMLEGAWRKHQVAHGDISPSSIMIGTEGVIKIAGLGQPFDPRAHPCCKAPEQTSSSATRDPRSDMFGLGHTLLYLANGRHPSPGKTASTKALSSHLAQLVARLTAKHADDRYPTWAEALSAIESIPPAKSKRRPTPGPRQNARTPDARDGRRPTPGPRRNRPTAKRDYMARFRPKKVPLWFRMPAGLLMLAFFVFLTHRQLNTPILQTIWQPPLPEPRGRDTASRTDTRTRARYAAASRGADNAAHRTVPGTAASAPREALNEADMARLNDLATPIAAALLNGHAAMARRAVAGLSTDVSPALRAELAALDALVTMAHDLDARVAAVFGEAIGATTSVSFGDTRRDVVPVAVSGAKVTVTLAGAGTEGAPITFSVAELDLAEKKRLLGNPRTAEEAVVQLLLCTRAGEWQQARMLAPACGPLADAFSTQLAEIGDRP